MNHVVLMGRLTKDPDIRYTNEGMSIARFTVAVDRRRSKDAESQADFISCVAFGKTAEIMEKYFAKGRRILLDGRIQTGSYEDKEGKRVYTTDVIVSNVEFVESKSSGGSSSDVTKPGTDDFVNIPDSVDSDSLPFN